MTFVDIVIPSPIEIDVVISQGIQGPPGEDGPPGPIGPPGEDGAAGPPGSGFVSTGRPKMGATEFWFIPGSQMLGVTNTTPAANFMYYFPWYLTGDMVIDRIAFEITATWAGVARLGIYNADIDWQPTTLVIDAGEVAHDTIGLKTITINQALPAGRYLAAWLASGSPQLRCINTGGPVGQGSGLIPGVGGAPFPWLWRTAQAYGLMPPNGPDWTAYTAGGTFFPVPLFCRIQSASVKPA